MRLVQDLDGHPLYSKSNLIFKDKTVFLDDIIVLSQGIMRYGAIILLFSTQILFVGFSFGFKISTQSD